MGSSLSGYFRWKNTSASCDKRVVYLIKRYNIPLDDARIDVSVDNR